MGPENNRAKFPTKMVNFQILPLIKHKKKEINENSILNIIHSVGHSVGQAVVLP